MPDTLPSMGAISTVVRALGALVLVGVLAGCTGDGGIVTTTPSPTVVAGSEGPSVTSESTASDEGLRAALPEEALVLDIGGAMFFADFWVEEFGRAYDTGDTSVLRGSATDECKYCFVQAENIERAYAQGATFDGGALEVDGAKTVAETRDDGYTYAAVTAEAAALEFRPVDGDPEQTSPAGTYSWQLQLIAVDGLWRVNGVFLELAG